MFYSNIIVDIPVGTKIQTKNKIKYVYFVVDQTYKKEKGYVVDKRVLIGKLYDEKSNKMVPNDNYYQYFKESEENKIQQAPIYSDTISLGANVAINKVARDLALDKLIVDTLGSEKIDGVESFKVILDLVSYFMVEETSVVQHYENYARRSTIINDKIVDDTYLSKFIKEHITEYKINKFLSKWCQKAYSKHGIYVSYDSTNINTRSLGVELAEYGHAKDDNEVPQVNLSYTLNEENNMPLFFEVYRGSINDVSEFKYMVNKAKEYGITNVNLMADRGYFSKENILELRINNHEFIMFLKTNLDSVKTLINMVKNSINSSKNYISEHNVYGLTIKQKLFRGDYEDTYFHIYHSEKNKLVEKTNLLQTVYKLREELDKKIGKILENTNRYNKYFTLNFDEKNELLSYEIKADYIDSVTENLGFFCIISSEEMTASTALTLYRKRDGIEKMFRMLKTELNYDTFRVHSDSSVLGKTFIMFIATIIRNEIHNRLAELIKSDRKNYTVNSSLRILKEIEISKNSKNIYVSKYALTSKQKSVLEALNVKEKDLKNGINDFNSRF